MELTDNQGNLYHAFRIQLNTIYNEAIDTVSNSILW